MALVGMDAQEVRRLALAMGESAEQLNLIERDMTALLAHAGWRGPDADRFEHTWKHCRTLLTHSSTALNEARTRLNGEAADQEKTSSSDGAIAGVGMVLTSSGAGDGNRGRDRDRNPDGRDGRRVRNDRLPGDRTGFSHTSNDWAGRAILDRYLSGGDDWTIDNDPTWTEYMESSPMLTQNVAAINDEQAKAAVEQYLQTGQTDGTFNTTSPMEMENGEGIVGHQYLHGTDANAGGFNHNGTTRVRPLEDGTYEVTVASNYRWNDRIDPNPQYGTDRWKSTIAEIITFGRADPYDIHIGWQGETTVIVDAHGNVVSGKGWPH